MNIFSTRPQSSYSVEVGNDVRMILFSKDKSYLPIVGSFGYMVQNYPSDIDLLEIYDDSSLHDSVYDTFLRVLNDIIEKIRYEHGFIFSEFKAGVDKRYDIDVGIMLNGVFKPSSGLIDKIHDMSNHGLISGEDYLIIKKLLTNSDKSDSYIYDYVTEFLHQYKTVRWSIDDIKTGFKILPASKRLNLKDAVRQRGVIKMDIFKVIGGKMMEMSNFLILAKKLTDGEMLSLNLDVSVTPSKKLTKQGLIELAHKMQTDIDKYLNSDGERNAFKAIKRMFSLTRLFSIMTNDRKYLHFGQELLPIVNSWVSSMYQISGEITNIGDALIKCSDCPTFDMRKCIKNIRTRILQTDELKIGMKTAMVEHINQSLMFDVVHMEHLYILQDIIDKITDEESREFLYSINVPSYVYPKERLYSDVLKYTISRQ